LKLPITALAEISCHSEYQLKRRTTNALQLLLFFQSATNESFHRGLFDKLLTAESERRKSLLPSSFFFF
jgi:hypothetical protein